ncbi:MAG: nucleotidyltransferase family protein [Oscillospiraceae bacterium]|nr:nucleotidyltransferase family protein [Oscillospiraceae bacterium]
MTEEQTRRAAQDLIYLAGCAVDEKKPDLKKVGDTDAVYAFASRHMLTAAASFALESAGQKDQRSDKAIAKALKRKIIFDMAYAQIKAELEKAGIWYMPLKGTVLQDFYPKAGMREMADHDILFDVDRADDVKAMMESLGFKAEHFGSGNHDCYYKAPVLNFEMHRSLFSTSHDEKLYGYYCDIGRRLIGEGCEKHFSPEDFYLYMTAHEYKHYSGSGTGLRSLLDTYVYLQKQELDMVYVTAEAEKLGIADFEAANRSLAQHLFSGGALTAAEKEMLGYILSSGTYGTFINSVSNKLRKNRWSKARYMLYRFFVPVSPKNKDYSMFAGEYPFFYKHKILLPLLPLYRTVRGLRSGRLKTELKALWTAKR